MKDLITLSIKKCAPSKASLPIEIPFEDRKRFFGCKDKAGPVGRKKQIYPIVTIFSCLQCDSFQIYDPRVRDTLRTCGKCLYPKKAPIESRRITSGFSAQLSGYRNSNNPDRPRKEKAKRGPNEKELLVEKGLTLGKSKEVILKSLSKHFPDMSKAYKNTLYYKVSKRWVKQKK